MSTFIMAKYTFIVVYLLSFSLHTKSECSERWQRELISYNFTALLTNMLCEFTFLTYFYQIYEVPNCYQMNLKRWKGIQVDISLDIFSI